MGSVKKESSSALLKTFLLAILLAGGAGNAQSPKGNASLADGNLICRSVDEDVEIRVKLMTPQQGVRLAELSVIDPNLKSRKKIVFRGLNGGLQFRGGTFIAHFPSVGTGPGLSRLLGIPVDQFRYFVLNIDLSFYEGDSSARLYSAEVVYNTRSHGILTQDFDCHHFPQRVRKIGKT